MEKLRKTNRKFDKEKKEEYDVSVQSSDWQGCHSPLNDISPLANDWLLGKKELEMEYVKSLAIALTRLWVLGSVFVFCLGIWAIYQMPYSMWYTKALLSIWMVIGVKIVMLIFLGNVEYIYHGRKNRA